MRGRGTIVVVSEDNYGSVLVNWSYGCSGDDAVLRGALLQPSEGPVLLRRTIS